MGIADDLFNQVKSNIEYKANSGVNSSINNATNKAFQKDNTPKCPKCSKPITAGQKFCQSCGVKLSVSCAKCNKDYPAGTKFCADCGGTLS